MSDTRVSERITLRIEKKQLDRVDAIAKRRGCKRSEVLRRAIRAYLARSGKA
jgi:metal-responsive CopG/Arc/MetJ family transcriptional regulator